MRTRDNKTMAIMMVVSCGKRDGGLELRCSIHLNESRAGSRVFRGAELGALVEAFDVHHMQELNGKPCWVDVTSDPSTIKWLGPCLIKATD